MIENWTFSLVTASKISAINSKTLSYYILNKVSDFAMDKLENRWQRKYDKISETGFCVKNNPVWKICIDEKDIQWQVYIIISNCTNNNIVWMYPWLKAKDVIKFFEKLIPKEWRESIEEISADMSSTIESIISALFPNAKLVTDRFHVMKNLLEDIRAVKSRIKTKIKKKILDEEKVFKAKLKLENKSINKIEKRKRWRPKKVKYKPKFYWNNESEIDIITRIWRQIRQRKDAWNENQINRREIAKTIPELKELIMTYEYLHELWMIYDSEETKETWMEKILQRINKWKELWRKIIEVDNMISTIKNRLDSISNYFISKHSNWYAEWLNSRIQKLISMSKWFKNKDYMIYRIIKLFSPNFHLV